MEDAKSDVVNPTIETTKIYSDEIDADHIDHVDDFYCKDNSDGVDNNLIIENEYENEMKKAESWAKHKWNIKHSEEFFIEAEKLERP
ncbi:hypothetical protein FNV43_RR05778 [Rhamnella rubrinervis]|uniref:Uncharacterized protein n=1 Tax=Rhamnella rubrinervis TaxID=2594499 RepID=A0A8K0MRY1_9ROSA|nr:hypothetical protein FNV43_RR05778 [Rhamnella rubrinervis]